MLALFWIFALAFSALCGVAAQSLLLHLGLLTLALTAFLTMVGAEKAAGTSGGVGAGLLAVAVAGPVVRQVGIDAIGAAVGALSAHPMALVLCVASAICAIGVIGASAELQSRAAGRPRLRARRALVMHQFDELPAADFGTDEDEGGLLQ